MKIFTIDLFVLSSVMSKKFEIKNIYIIKTELMDRSRYKVNFFENRIN